LSTRLCGTPSSWLSSVTASGRPAGALIVAGVNSMPVTTSVIASASPIGTALQRDRRLEASETRQHDTPRRRRRPVKGYNPPR